MLTSNICRLGDPKPIRDFIYVQDQVNGYLAALENKKAIGETFNICSGRGVTIEELARIIKELSGFNGKIAWETMPKRPVDIDDLVGSNKKIRNMLDVPKPISLEDGLQLTIDLWRKKLVF